MVYRQREMDPGWGRRVVEAHGVGLGHDLGKLRRALTNMVHTINSCQVSAHVPNLYEHENVLRPAQVDDPEAHCEPTWTFDCIRDEWTFDCIRDEWTFDCIRDEWTF